MMKGITMNHCNQKGVSLVELLIYMVLFSIVALLIQKQITHMQMASCRDKQLSEIQMNSRDAYELLVREIQNTGCKVYLSELTNGLERHYDPLAYISDSSSFVHKQGNPSDTLKIYKTHLSENGGYERSDSIEYYLKDSTLVRKIDNKELRICPNVYALQFQYGIVASDSLVCNLYSPSNWAAISVKGSAPNLEVQGSTVICAFNSHSASEGRIYNISSFSVPVAERLKVSLNLNPSPELLANLDSAYCSIFDGSHEVCFERFIPQNTPTTLMLSSPAVTNAKIAIRYWLKNGSGTSETLAIASVLIKRKDDGSYAWDYDPPSNKKKYVRAINIAMLARTKGNTGVSHGDTPISIGDITYKKYQTLQYSWRSYDELTPVPNNGLF
jgi:hypothetical protein